LRETDRAAWQSQPDQLCPVWLTVASDGLIILELGDKLVRCSRANLFFYFHPCLISLVKLFYTGPVVNTEMLVVMLEKHGINATQEFVDPELPDDGNLNRLAKVLVPENDYDRAHQLFYAGREDEL
jgi:hypothetical protein